MFYADLVLTIFSSTAQESEIVHGPASLKAFIQDRLIKVKEAPYGLKFKLKIEPEKFSVELKLNGYHIKNSPMIDIDCGDDLDR